MEKYLILIDREETEITGKDFVFCNLPYKEYGGEYTKRENTYIMLEFIMNNKELFVDESLLKLYNEEIIMSDILRVGTYETILKRFDIKISDEEKEVSSY